MNPNMFVDDPTLLFFSSCNHSDKYNHIIQSLTPISQNLALEFGELKDNEVDRYIILQTEKLRILLQEQRAQQVAELLEKVESDAFYMLSQKDEQLAQAAKKRIELEEFLRRLEAENQSWRRVAQENETMVLSLHNALEQMKERASHVMAMEDVESCCDEIRRDMGMEEQICKGCNSRSSCFMFLPCRHLCSCRNCEAFLQACPVCRTQKKYSIETLIF
ncbi:probable BOI-related E3 ubiquitin-protein ligase 2 [Abrus precatorius]|uniref:Probable BOI-related E3 ubiquitin-protein ligase 2 n=1 Tax=Abrus precatorius TaxID=3816 RepID=A0A8B8LM49_ABRPR|nr:probable BOI-related E3 ubiquitin-protein ligase 2 [Abrus precatorius]